MMKRPRRLDEVDSDTSIGDKLRKCLELDIPVLIQVPASMDVWAIDPKLNQLTKKDVVLSESNVVTQLPLRIHLLGGQSLPPSEKPHIHTSNLVASTKLAHVEYLQLKHSDIPRLLALHQLELGKFDAVFVYDNETCEYSLCKSVPVSRYSFSIDETDSRANLESALIGKIKFSDRELDYVVCNQYSGEEQYNHPVDIIENCSVTQSECWILEEHLSLLTFDNSSYETSRFFLEPRFHISTAFVELSKAAFELLEMGKKPISGGTSGYLGSKHKCFKPKYVREGGTWIINRSKKEPGNNYFEKLKGIFETYWAGKHNQDNAEVRRVTQNVIYILETELGLKSSSANGVEMILRPDKYK
ncbi:MULTISPECIES: hypothetical protein [Vibrio]|uniref:hypothetical protein n=1 Tax=Vibrio TaxID=662 RepID=UPI002022E060|nr:MULTISPECIES: hypothetical protein [Vibrio]MDW2140141.1 hypothetical protein [Vibrio sp. 1833]